MLGKKFFDKNSLKYATNVRGNHKKGKSSNRKSALHLFDENIPNMLYFIDI